MAATAALPLYSCHLYMIQLCSFLQVGESKSIQCLEFLALLIYLQSPTILFLHKQKIVKELKEYSFH